MKKAPVIIMIILGVAIVGVYASTVQPMSKVALLITDDLEYHTGQIRVVEDVLVKYNYVIYHISHSEDMADYRANRVLVVYIGHGVDDFSPTLVLSDAQLDGQEFLSHIKAEELILIIGSCHAGSWMEFSAPDCMIVTVCNITVTYTMPERFSPYGVEGAIPNLFLLADIEHLPFEGAYQVWEWQIVGWWYRTYLLHGFTPLMDDRIEGDVYL